MPSEPARGAKQERGLHVRIPAALYRQVAVDCAQRDQTLKEFVIDALEYYLLFEEAQDAAAEDVEGDPEAFEVAFEGATET